MNKKLGRKIAKGELTDFPKSREGQKQAVDMVRDTMLNRTSITKPFVNSSADKVIDIYSGKTGYTVRVKSDGTFVTLFKGISGEHGK